MKKKMIVLNIIILLEGDNKIYSIDECCSESAIICENGYITNINA